MQTAKAASVELYWLPLGAGDTPAIVRWSGRAFDALVAHHEHRERRDLYHSALEVHLDGERFVIEMTPVWRANEPSRGVVCEGAVGHRWLGYSRFFRYEVHCWRGGVIPDVAEAVASPRAVSVNRKQAELVLALVSHFPAATWGRDELRAGEMWNSNSLISWLLACSGHETSTIDVPLHGRAPGWSAGLVVAGRQTTLRTRAARTNVTSANRAQRARETGTVAEDQPTPELPLSRTESSTRTSP
jgi:hypothetical protein